MRHLHGTAHRVLMSTVSTAFHPILPVQRPWGSYQTLACGPGYLLKRIVVAPGQRISLQSHAHRREHWLVVAGPVQVTLDGRQFSLPVGGHCDIAVGQVHRLSNPGTQPAEIVEVQLGDDLREDDITRFGDDYGRV